MKILNARIDGHTKTQLEDLISESLKKSQKIKICKVNTEFLHRSIKDERFSEVLNSSDVNIVDGRGVLWSARYLTLPVSDKKHIRPAQAVLQMIYSGAGIVLQPKSITYPIAEAIPGVDAFKLMMNVASKNKVGVFIFGGSKPTLDLAVKNIKKEFPELIISGTLNGYDFQKDDSINPISIINKTDAKILIVALGSPKQEYWINENIDKLDKIQIAVGEGGTLDRIANPSQKAPKFVNQIGMEWFWRTLFNKSKTETRNRAQKFWNAVPVFIYLVVKWKIKNGQAKI